VPNFGYRLNIDGEKMFYATDTNTLEHITTKGYNLYLIEANYGEDEIIERINNKLNNGEYSYELDVTHNHLSREKAEKWLANNAGENSLYVFLHMHEER
jgi:hypothetical protein